MGIYTDLEYGPLISNRLPGEVPTFDQIEQEAACREHIEELTRERAAAARALLPAYIYTEEAA